MVVAVCSAGCVKPEDDYQAFIARPVLVRDGGVADVTLTKCDQLLEENLDGVYYTSCRPRDLPVPFALAVNQTVKRAADGGATTLSLSFTPLKINAASVADTIGTVITVDPATLDANCAYTMNIGTLTLPKNANSLNRDLTATGVLLRGRLQTVERSCGELDGRVDLIDLSLAGDGDICVFVRAPDDGSIPTVNDPGDYACSPSDLPPR